jgi:hypothetical protein
VDHEWAQSIYFHDPNGISLEYCFLTRDIGTEDDVTLQVRVERPIQGMRQRWERLRQESLAAFAPALNASPAAEG